MTVRDFADYRADHNVAAAACLNCGAPLTGPFCSSCGQKKPQNDPTLREFLHETTHELTDWDGKVPRTLKALVLHPGLLTIDVLEGRRERWLTPLRLYLLTSLAFFLSGPFVERITHRSVREVAKISITNSDGTTNLTPETRAAIAEGLPGRLFGVERMERAALHSGQLNSSISASMPKAMFVLLPLFALLTSIAWRGRRRGYPAHLYLALHLHAAWFLAFAVTTLVAGFVESPVVQGVAALTTAVYLAWYTLVALRRVFGESRLRTFGKMVAVAIAYFPCWFAVSMGLMAYALLTM